MRTITIAIVLAVLGGVAPAIAEIGARPMHEMHGDCANYRWDLRRELQIWAGPETTLALAAHPDRATSRLEAGIGYRLRLLPHPEVRFVAPPERDRGGPDRFSGLGRFIAPADGLYRVSAGSGLWIDVAADGRRIPSVGFEMQTQCRTIFKSVAFRLRGGAEYWLQISGNRLDTVRLLVTYVGP